MVFVFEGTMYNTWCLFNYLALIHYSYQYYTILFLSKEGVEIINCLMLFDDQSV